MELFRKVYIKSEDDLPQEKGDYIVHLNYGKIAYRFHYDPIEDIPEWIENIDWYLQPIEISDADIEAWADGIANPESKKAFERGEWLGIKEGARAMRDGKIKKIEK